MQQNSATPAYTRRSAGQIRKLISEFKQSGLSVKEFSSLHNISRASFHNWQSKYGTVKTKRASEVGFARLEITPPLQTSAQILFAEVSGIKLYQPVEASYLKKLRS